MKRRDFLHATVAAASVSILPGQSFAGPTFLQGPFRAIRNKWTEQYLAAHNSTARMIKESETYTNPFGWDTGYVTHQGRKIATKDGKDWYVRLKGARTDGSGNPIEESRFLHVQQRKLEFGEVEPGWWSAMWVLEPVDARYGRDFYRIRNRWIENYYIHVQNGSPEAGPVQPGWWSAMWRIV